MKVLATLDFPPSRGGIQRYLGAIVGHCYGPGDRVLVAGAAAPDAAGTFAATVEYVKSPRKTAGRIYVLFRRLLLVRLRNRPVDVECGNVYAGLAALALRLLCGQQYRVYTYGTEVLALIGSSAKSRLLRHVLTMAQEVYVLGAFTADLLARAGVRTPTAVRAPRIELPVGAPEPGAAGNRRGAPFSVLSVGRMVPHKGHAVLLAAAATLPDRQSWRVVLVGDGPRRAALEEQCRSQDLAGMVQFAGEVPDAELSELYRNADALAFPSISLDSGVEGFGIVLLEAMAYGVPIVASNTGGIPEVLDNGACGLLVEPGSPEALAHALLRVRHDPALRREMVERARARLMERYVW